ncbi:MAG: nucleotidyltransferase family protein, partial [Eubacteriales bacterium]|nr:nucleotidyltransferase family protein [Eubacteriales bacterium]
MKVIGIVGEYNPFHNGHLHHIEESRAIIGEDAAVLCVMSGDYVQRGEPAMFSKFARAEAAVRCGASLVLELPLPWCLSSAEGFCRGAVGLLGATGVVDYLSFGSEAGSIDPLSALAIAIMNPGLDEQIRKELETGISYAAARQHALESELGELAKHLEKPNNILAVEYLRALYELRLPMMPMTVVRTGAGHDQKGEGSLRSASELRSLLHTGHDVSAFIPAPTVDVFQREMRMGRGPMPNPALETAILSRLRAYDEHLFENIPDASEGLDNRLRTA